MRKIILGLAVSLDGFIEGPKGEYDWCFTDQDYGMSEFIRRIDTIFMGRKSYEVAAAAGGENPWKGVQTIVFSNTLKSIDAPDTRLMSGDALAEARLIRATPGKDIWLFGGAALTSSFLKAGLIDVLWLSVHPVLLGSGKPLFQHLESRKQLRLVEATPYDSGLVSLKYEFA